MRYRNGHCNGIVCKPLDRDVVADMKARAERLFDRAQEEITLGSPHIPGLIPFLFGDRFCDANNIAHRAASHLTENADEQTKDDFIMAAYIDAANSDHYYYYSKNWDDE